METVNSETAMQFYDFVVERVCSNIDGLACKRLAITCKLLNDLVRRNIQSIKTIKIHEHSQLTSLKSLVLIEHNSIVKEFPPTLKILRVYAKYCFSEHKYINSIDRKTILPLCLEEFTTDCSVIPKIDHLLCLVKVKLIKSFDYKSIIFPPTVTHLKLGSERSCVDMDSVWDILPPNLVEFTIYCQQVNAGDISKLPCSLRKFGLYVSHNNCNISKDRLNDGLIEFKTNINIDNDIDLVKLPKSLTSISLAMIAGTYGSYSGRLMLYLSRTILHLDIIVKSTDPYLYKNLPPLLKYLSIDIHGGGHLLDPTLLPGTLTTFKCSNYLLIVREKINKFPTSLVELSGIIFQTDDDAVKLDYLTSLERLDIMTESKVTYPPYIKYLVHQRMIGIPPESTTSLTCDLTNLATSDLEYLPNLTKLSINKLIYDTQIDLVKFPPNLTCLVLRHNTLTTEQLTNLPLSLASFTGNYGKHANMRIVPALYETKRIINDV